MNVKLNTVTFVRNYAQKALKISFARPNKMDEVSYNDKSEYSKKMEQLSRQIFNEVVTPTDKSCMRVVEKHMNMPLYKNPHYVDWYPRLPEISKLMGILREYGLYRDEHLDFREEYARLRLLRGKTPFVPKNKKTGEKIIFKKKNILE